ncbi:MAG: CHAD domain-containing protein [Rhizobiaceae bacterium]
MSFRIDPAKSCSAELKRVTLLQIDQVRRHALAVAENPLKSPHEARKAIKKIRAVLRLARGADKSFYRSENARWRDISASLAGPREAAALIETVDRFIGEFADDGNRSTLLTLRAHLVMRLEMLKSTTDALEAAGRDCVAGCDEGARAVAHWPLPRAAKAGAHLLAKGAKRAWKEAEAARQEASRTGAEDDFHDLRKAVKRHWAHLALLRDFWPAPVKKRREAVEALGDMLGELNDIYVMEGHMRTGEIETGFDTEGRFARLLERKRLELCRDSLAEAEKLFGKPPGDLKARFEAAMARAGAKPKPPKQRKAA